MKKVLFSGTYGLGDHLQHSTLPRRFTELGYTVELSNRNCYRNDGIRQIVWECNPYIKGITSDHPDIGTAYAFQDLYNLSEKYQSYTMGVEACHGLEPLSKYPEIYYEPKINTKAKFIIDCGAITSSGKYCNDDMLGYLLSRNIDKKDIITLNCSLDGYARYDTCNIFEYCDIIYSAEEYIGYYSGGSVLTSAIQGKYNSRLKNTMLIKSDYLIDWWNRWNFRFDNIDGVIL